MNHNIFKGVLDALQFAILVATVIGALYGLALLEHVS